MDPSGMGHYQQLTLEQRYGIYPHGSIRDTLLKTGHNQSEIAAGVGDFPHLGYPTAHRLAQLTQGHEGILGFARQFQHGCLNTTILVLDKLRPIWSCCKGKCSRQEKREEREPPRRQGRIGRDNRIDRIFAAEHAESCSLLVLSPQLFHQHRHDVLRGFSVYIEA